MQCWRVSWFLIWVDAIGGVQLWGRKQCEYGGNLSGKGKAGMALGVQQEKKMWKMPVILSDSFIVQWKSAVSMLHVHYILVLVLGLFLFCVITDIF